MKVRELLICCGNVFSCTKVEIVNLTYENLFSCTCADILLYNSSYIDVDVRSFWLTRNGIKIMVRGK